MLLRLSGVVVFSSLMFVLVNGRVAFAQSYGMAGCGLGSMLFKDNSKTQILAATTNGSSGNQTFGITSGTSNCSGSGKSAQIKRQEEFFAANFSHLSKEIAQGSGELISSLAEGFGCSPEVYDQVRVTLKDNHAHIFEVTDVSNSLQRTRNVLSNETSIKSSCKALLI